MDGASTAELAGDFEAISEHGVLFEQFGVAGWGTPPPHELGHE